MQCAGGHTQDRGRKPPRQAPHLKGLRSVRIHINLDDIPEFESYTSMFTAVRGAHWSVTNTNLGDDLADDQRDKLLRAIEQVEETLKPIAMSEAQWLARRRAAKERFLTDGGSIEVINPVD